jgi:regulator of nucleoside diphosphate kinase
MKTDTNPVILCEEDYNKLSHIINLQTAATDEMTLAYEVSRAIVVKDNAFPHNTIRIGSHVTILDVDTGKEKIFQIVMPGEADMKAQKVSVLSPMAAAIIGFRAGEEVTWKMPAGLKKLKIVTVQND